MGYLSPIEISITNGVATTTGPTLPFFDKWVKRCLKHSGNAHPTHIAWGGCYDFEGFPGLKEFRGGFLILDWFRQVYGLTLHPYFADSPFEHLALVKIANHRNLPVGLERYYLDFEPKGEGILRWNPTGFVDWLSKFTNSPWTLEMLLDLFGGSETALTLNSVQVTQASGARVILENRGYGIFRIEEGILTCDRPPKKWYSPCLQISLHPQKGIVIWEKTDLDYLLPQINQLELIMAEGSEIDRK